MSEFLIRIARKNGDPVHLYPNGKGERDFIDAIIAKGVGLLRSEKQVRAAISEVLMDLKSEVHPTQV